MKLRDIEVFPALISYQLQNTPDRFDRETGALARYDGQMGHRYHPTRAWGMWKVGEYILEVGVQTRGAPDFCGGSIMNSARVNTWCRDSRWDPTVGMSLYLYDREPANKPEYWGLIDEAGLVDLAEVYPKVDLSDREVVRKLGFHILAQYVASLAYETGGRGMLATDRAEGETETLVTTLESRTWQPVPIIGAGCMCVHDLSFVTDSETLQQIRNWEQHRKILVGRMKSIPKQGMTRTPIGYTVTSTPEFLNKNSGSQVMMHALVADKWTRYHGEEFMECEHCSADAFYDEYEDGYYCDECGNMSTPPTVETVSIDKRLLPPLDNDHYLRAAPAYYWRNG